MTTNCTNNRLSVLSSVLSVVGCYALRLKSLSMPYSCRAYTLYGSPALCKVGRDEYDRTDIENGNTACAGSPTWSMGGATSRWG